MIDWGMFAAAGGVAAVISAAIAFAVFWFNRGREIAAGTRASAEVDRLDRDVKALADSRERYRSDLDTKFIALYGTITLHHDEMLRDYVHKNDLLQFETRFVSAQRDIGDRLGKQIEALGDRLDKRIDNMKNG